MPHSTDTMKAWVMTRVTDVADDARPLERVDLPMPEPSTGEIRIRVDVCAVCHTELDEIEGRTPPPFYPMVPGHQVVGVVDAQGKGTKRFKSGTRVGVAWIYAACGQCVWCRRGEENLCPDFLATGRDVNGGYAEYMIVPERFAYPIPAGLSDAQAAPLLCAGAIGYRSLRLTGLENGQPLGLTGFGASAHLVLKMVQYRYPDTPVFVFARSEREQQFARDLGAQWAGGTTQEPPQRLQAIIDTTPAWLPVVEALAHLLPGGRLVVNAIRKEAGDRDCLLQLDYPRHLWMEKELKSVANVTRTDVTEFLKLAARIPLLPEFQLFPFAEANRALAELKRGEVQGAKVLVVAGGDRAGNGSGAGERL
jgi:propanol-preferring alcohol dehydrogenase